MFGWSAATVDRPTLLGIHHYTVLSLGDRPIAGIVKRSARAGEETHGRWIGFLSVPDVAEALSTAVSEGGRVLSPTRSFAARGTQAVFADPDGAVVGFMHSSSGDPGEYLPRPGEWTWAELFARDPGTAATYYHNVVGFNVSPIPAPTGRATYPRQRRLFAGRDYLVPDRPRAHPAWLLYVRVENVKEAAAKAVSLGGRVLVPPSDDASESWRAILADPTGAPFGVVQLEDAPKAKEGP